MRTKRIFTLVLVLVLCIVTCVGCGSDDGKYGNTVVSGGPKDTEAVVIVGDEVLSVREFRYYVYEAAMEKAYSIDPNAVNDISAFDWNQKNADGKPIKDDIIENALDTVLRESIMTEKARENGIVLSEEDIRVNSQQVEGQKIQYGEDFFLLSANAIGISDIDGYKNLVNRKALLEMAQAEISENISNYMEADMDLSAWKSDDKVTAQHVLITSNSETYSDPEATAQEVLAKAKAGEDFAKLIEEYNEDPGATAAGYTFGRGEMVKEFEEAAYALECGELSEVVKTEFGYHIIHRIAGLAELQNYWVKNVDYTVKRDIVAQISVEEIVKAAANAQKELQDINAAKK